METQETKALSKELSCKNCGGTVVYTPGSDVVKCEYCGTENEIEQDEQVIEEQDFNAILAGLDEGQEHEEVQVVKCHGCGAETQFDPNEAAGECAFCGTHIVLEGGSSKKVIKPKSLLPFKIEKREGYKLFEEWVKGLWFAPSDLKKKARTNKLTGIYLPFWTYDSNSTCAYTGMRGRVYYTTETYTTTVDGKSVTRTRQVERVDWTPCSGTVYNSFDDVLVAASNSLKRKYLDKLEPWDLENLTGFQEQYLTGYEAESYQVGLAEGFDHAKDKMIDVIRSSVRSDIGGDRQRIITTNVQYNDISFKHILLPVWLSTFRYNQKLYTFMINARTGEVQGERPWSWIKITLLVLAVVAAGVLAWYFLGDQ